jgi:outer membrane lipoprotein SlyB
MKKRLLAVLVVVAMLAGCKSWDKVQFQALSASKAVIDQAVEDYNSGVIPRTRENAELIDKARGVDRAAVQAFYLYAVAEVIGAPGSDVAAKKQAVATAVAGIVSLSKDIKALLEQFDPNWQAKVQQRQARIERDWKNEYVRLQETRQVCTDCGVLWSSEVLYGN